MISANPPSGRFEIQLQYQANCPCYSQPLFTVSAHAVTIAFVDIRYPARVYNGVLVNLAAGAQQLTLFNVTADSMPCSARVSAGVVALHR